MTVIQIIFLVVLMGPPMYQASDFKVQILEEHNKVRSKHGVPNLQWNTELENFAQSWCDNLATSYKFKHSQNSIYGENLFMRSGRRKSRKSMPFPAAVKAWYAEELHYDYDDPSWTPKAGHFTQVVWRGTKELGCAQSVAGLKWVRTYVCCEYLPAGNIVSRRRNYFAENIPRPTN